MASPRSIGTLAVIVILSACVAVAEDLAGVEEVIRATNTDYIQLFPEGDVDKLMRLYVEDAVLIPPDAPTIDGADAVRASWTAFFSEWSVIEATSIIDEIIVGGDWAWSRGHYRETNQRKSDGEIVIEGGRFSSIWRKQPDGSWRIARDMWNSDGSVETVP